MVYCYTDDNSVFLGNCVNTKAYFILYVADPVEDSYIIDGQSGFYFNNYGWTGYPYSDGDVLYIYESIEEAEEDDEDMATAFFNEMLENASSAEYQYTFLEEYCVRLGSITFPDPIGFNTEPTVTWTINNKEVQSLTINNKEVQSIVRVDDGVTIYIVPPPLPNTIIVNSVTLTQGNDGNRYSFNLTLINIDSDFYYFDNINGVSRDITHNTTSYTYDTGQFGYGPSTLPFTYILSKGDNIDYPWECARITITSTTPPYTN
jgi:hypothetical protein